MLMPNNFHPMRFAKNPHLQTLLPRIVRYKPQITPVWQRITLPDEDFLDLAWSEKPELATHKPRLVIFHGLEGNFRSPYAHGMLETAKKQGWLGVIMHFRGCSGEPNRQPRIYHSGETNDARYFLQWLKQTYGDVATGAVGYSLGGNMLACYLANYAQDPYLNAGVVVSAPLMLEPCSVHLETGSAQFYERYLLRCLKHSVDRKLTHYPETLPVNLAELKKIKRLREFDNAITAPIHGFKDAVDYYQRCSALPLLPRITLPTLIIHAKDDPFMSPDVIPNLQTLPSNIEYQLTEYGGHIGFVGGTLRHPTMWLEQRIPHWLAPYLRKSV